MTRFFTTFIAVFAITLHGQEAKWKHFKLKSTNLGGWVVKEFAGNKTWDDTKNEWCKCAALYFTKSWNGKKLNVLVYPIAASPDSVKYTYAGKFVFQPEEKYEQIRNKNFSFRKTKSYLVHSAENKKYPCIRYITKPEKHSYIIYAWAEDPNLMDGDTEKELFSLINSFELL
ncbi:MAG: hypothetical protein N3F09_10305 [Bacteroidia bacterium]|nr:hypothetical protein [Bacteroidia bacterium]